MKWFVALALLIGIGAAGLPLKMVARSALPGPENRFDYQSIDSRAHRLYIAHMDADSLLVVDTRSLRVVKNIHAQGVHGSSPFRVSVGSMRPRRTITRR